MPFTESNSFYSEEQKVNPGPYSSAYSNTSCCSPTPGRTMMEQIVEELRKTKKELSLATEAEEKSRKAMDDLASVLKEVAAEASEAKQNLQSTLSDLKATKTENKQIKLKLEATEERLASVTAERNEFKNEAERLRLEADDTLANWNVKESGLVGCMKNVEEERSRARAENSVLREDMKKLRDILKQAMTETIAAKEDASLARRENAELKDQLAEKDTALNFISRELESLRASEAAFRRCSLNDLNLQLVESGTNSPDSKTTTRSDEKQIEIKAPKVHKSKGFNFGLGCSGRKKRLEDLVADKVVKGGSNRKNSEILAKN